MVVGRGVLVGSGVAVGRGVLVGSGVAVGRGVLVGSGVRVGSTASACCVGVAVGSWFGASRFLASATRPQPDNSILPAMNMMNRRIRACDILLRFLLVSLRVSTDSCGV
jgi:tetrahydrodipicolinate N-succinyltransferase